MVQNCAIVGCNANSRRCRGLTFHSLPKEEKNKAWREQIIRIINRSDKNFNPDKIKLCSRHFKESCFQYMTSGKRKLKVNSLPTEFLPGFPGSPAKVPRKKMTLFRDIEALRGSDIGGQNMTNLRYAADTEFKADATTAGSEPWTLRVEDTHNTENIRIEKCPS